MPSTPEIHQITHYLVVNSFSTIAKDTFRRSCRFLRTFFVILFWCRVLLSHSMPKYTFTWHPGGVEYKSSIWYRMWTCKWWNGTGQWYRERWVRGNYKSYEKDYFKNSAQVPGHSYIEIVTKWNRMEGHDFLNKPTISIREAGFLLSTSHLSSILGNTFVISVIYLPHTDIALLWFPWGVRIVKTTSFLHNSTIQFTSTE